MDLRNDITIIIIMLPIIKSKIFHDIGFSKNLFKYLAPNPKIESQINEAEIAPIVKDVLRSSGILLETPLITMQVSRNACGFSRLTENDIRITCLTLDIGELS